MKNTGNIFSWNIKKINFIKMLTIIITINIIASDKVDNLNVSYKHCTYYASYTTVNLMIMFNRIKHCSLNLFVLNYYYEFI